MNNKYIVPSYYIIGSLNENQLDLSNLPEYPDIPKRSSQSPQYRNKEKTLPHFVQLSDFTSQVKAVVDIIKKNPDASIGILLYSNSLVEQTCKQLYSADIKFEYKFQIESAAERKVYGNLDFRTDLPKVMTYHSAKGLQFDIVILPMYEGANSNDSRKSLYVAMTRTMHKLYVLYSTPDLRPPLNVPSHLYKKDL